MKAYDRQVPAGTTGSLPAAPLCRFPAHRAEIECGSLAIHVGAALGSKREKPPAGDAAVLQLPGRASPFSRVAWG